MVLITAGKVGWASELTSSIEGGGQTRPKIEKKKSIGALTGKNKMQLLGGKGS